MVQILLGFGLLNKYQVSDGRGQRTETYECGSRNAEVGKRAEYILPHSYLLLVISNQ